MSHYPICTTISTYREAQLDEPEDCLALAPYLDMFNHSPSADVEAGLDLVEVDDRHNYQIVSNVGFERHSEVFISYGRHGNMGHEDSNRKFSSRCICLGYCDTTCMTILCSVTGFRISY